MSTPAGAASSGPTSTTSTGATPTRGISPPATTSATSTPTRWPRWATAPSTARWRWAARSACSRSRWPASRASLWRWTSRPRRWPPPGSAPRRSSTSAWSRPRSRGHAGRPVRPDRLLRGPLLLGRSSCWSTGSTPWPAPWSRTASCWRCTGPSPPASTRSRATRCTTRWRAVPTWRRCTATRDPTTGSTCCGAREHPAWGGHRRGRAGRAGHGTRVPRGGGRRPGDHPHRRGPRAVRAPAADEGVPPRPGCRARSADRGRAVVRPA